MCPALKPSILEMVPVLEGSSFGHKNTIPRRCWGIWKADKFILHSLPTQSCPCSLWQSGVSEECRVLCPGGIPSPELFHRELIPNPDTSCHVRFKSLPFHARYSSENANTRQWTCTTCEHFGFWAGWWQKQFTMWRNRLLWMSARAYG